MAIYSPTILSLATGYGGIELGVELLFPGARTVCYVEREGYAAANLVARFQDETMVEAPIWDDVATFDGKPWRKKVDWIVGGYPCQPFSVAGKRAGTKDPRHLWPEFARIISEVSPAICFFENVSNHLKLGFLDVARDLHRMGFKVTATLVTAEEVGAPHKRERLFILAVKLSDADGVDLWKQSKRRQSKPTECQDAQSREIGEALADATGLLFTKFPTTGTSRVGHIGEELAYTEHSGRRAIVSECNPTRELDDHRLGKKDTRRTLVRGEKLADPQGDDRWCKLEAKESRFWRPGSPRVDKELGDTNDIHGGEAVVWEAGSFRHDQPGILFPPGRNDFEGWQSLLERHPDLAPAIESKIRQSPHGHPYWVDELHLNGNGVVPLQAAYALAALLADTVDAIV